MACALNEVDDVWNGSGCLLTTKLFNVQHAQYIDNTQLYIALERAVLLPVMISTLFTSCSLSTGRLSNQTNPRQLSSALKRGEGFR
jgi:hypothetical protein